MAHDGLARCIDPVHTPYDGDTLFALATGASGKPGDLTVLGALAAEVTARAVLNAVHHAIGLPGAARGARPRRRALMARCDGGRCHWRRSSSARASARGAIARR